MAKTSKIQLYNLNLGGIADSAYLGGKNSVAEMVGFDIHSEPGILKVNQRLFKNSGSVVDDLVKAMVTCSDGYVYLFGSTNSKIWKRDFIGGGTYALEATGSPGSGITGAMEYEGYIYYAFSGSTRLGRWQLGTAWSTRTDNWATLNSSTSYRPMKIVNDVLYIGDGSQVAQVDAGVFTANALDLNTKFTITCLGQLGTDLLIGTSVNDTSGAQIFRWNTWGISFTNSDPIVENTIWAFLEGDNHIMVVADKGKIYLYNGSTLDNYKTIPGTWTFGRSSKVNYNAVLNYNGLPLFGLSRSGSASNNATHAVWSLGRANRNYPYVLNCEVGLSTGTIVNLEIGSMVKYLNGDEAYLVAWRNLADNTYGVDEFSSSLKYAAPYILSRVMMVDRFNLSNFGTLKVGWRTRPSGTSFTFSTKKNNGTLTAISSGEVLSDSQRNIDYTKTDINEATTLQVKIEPVVSGASAPEIEMIELDLTS
jgi:hypothetical protein